MFYTCIVDRTNQKILYAEEHRTRRDADTRRNMLDAHVAGNCNAGRDTPVVNGDPLMDPDANFEVYVSEKPFEFTDSV